MGLEDFIKQTQGLFEGVEGLVDQGAGIFGKAKEAFLPLPLPIPPGGFPGPGTIPQGKGPVADPLPQNNMDRKGLIILAVVIGAFLFLSK